jgi:hypothetical protein
MRPFFAVHIAVLFTRAAAEEISGLPIIADPDIASAVVGGIAGGFMDKQELPSIEQKCIVSGVKTMAKEIVKVSKESVELLEDVVGKPPPNTPQTAVSVGQTEMEGTSLIVQIRVNLVKLMDLEMELTSDCIRGDALAEIDVATQHLQNISFVGNHLLANGADIAVEITQAIEAFQHKKFTVFGRTLGTTLRKVLLTSPKSALPGGKPTRYALQKMSEGIVEGYFGKGFFLSVSNPELPHPLNTKIDLHKCIGGNVQFFQSSFAAAWLFFQHISKKESDGANKYNGAWEAALAQAVIRMPEALKLCGITSEQEAMLQDSIKAISAFQFKLNIPRHTMETSEISVVLARTVKDWTKAHWYKFGKDLGQLLQQMVLLTYPQEYSLDASGMLKRELNSGRGSWAAPVLLSGGVAMLLLLAVVTRVTRRLTARQISRDACDQAEMSRRDAFLEEDEEASAGAVE